MSDNPYQPPASRLIDRPVDHVYPIEHESFAGRGFALRPPRPFGASVLVIDGADVSGKRGRYTVRDNAGNPVEIRLKRSGVDPVPKVVIGERTIQVARPLAWYEYGPLALSWVLIPLGGALGAVVGIVVSVISARILRSDRPSATRLVLATTISVGAVLGYLVFAGLLNLVLGRYVDLH